jgi:hypothetical protein
VTCQSLTTNPSPLLAANAAEFSALAREYVAWTATPPRRQRRPTLATIAKQARKAGIEAARYEIKPDGTVIIVTGTPEPSTESNPWLADLRKEAKQ